ncbi:MULTISPECIES: 3-oxoacyl-[acyl-carrier-protein] synthase III C-terminal domain-containing protein [Kitasatospora]|uniref:Beta-ketoacyl-[acyl-carrier-protein] synthase III C-terminal domain-containing protein n=1 Tax=Kitasatospora setae (strain ATCC 33774 / DSM 43861 / JCM 3304 / KCC A-0304 / NBRC 14216 / KM-6054) TaxID=452652 RepID=E4N2G0_KITSK|nr:MULTISPECIES: 3-oxoacyl-[acyl-carrier-protein] synthase III C-terminal domain-containing protein [Kitasatospora]BAJ32344.1 hypothetical protein KSE_65850 [Kitasatospora setae KM-6054]
MTAVIEVSAHVPERRVAIADIADELGLDAFQLRLFQRFLGLRHVLTAPGRDLREILTAAARGLTGLPGNEHRVRYVIAARTAPTAGPAARNHLHETCADLGLGHAIAFTVTQQACASGLAAVDLAGRLLAEDGDPDALALVLTGEKADTEASRLIPGTTVMGEATAACLVRATYRDHPGPGALLGYAAHTRGEFQPGDMTAELAARFQEEYAEMLAGVVRAAVADAGATLPDLALILPHNVNRNSWVRVCKLLGFPVDRVFLENIPETGHCFSADSFLNYADAVRGNRLNSGDLYLMAAVGLGATFSAMVFRH